jgi:hypothetical protein
MGVPFISYYNPDDWKKKQKKTKTFIHQDKTFNYEIFYKRKYLLLEEPNVPPFH